MGAEGERNLSDRDTSNILRTNGPVSQLARPSEGRKLRHGNKPENSGCRQFKLQKKRKKNSVRGPSASTGVQKKRVQVERSVSWGRTEERPS